MVEQLRTGGSLCTNMTYSEWLPPGANVDKKCLRQSTCAWDIHMALLTKLQKHKNDNCFIALCAYAQQDYAFGRISLYMYLYVYLYTF